MSRKPQPGWAIYKEQMDFLCFGDALWEPTPTVRYPRINIGDVGFIRRGKFHLLFSAGVPLGDRQLGDDVPTTFEPLDVGTLDFSQPRQPGCLRTSTVRQIGVGLGATASASLPLEPGASFSYELTEDRGAALVTKYSTYRMDALIEDAFKGYTERYYKSWVEFIRNKQYGKDVQPVLVTGLDVTRDFAMVAYSHEGTSLESDFTIAVPALASASASVWGTWRTRCSPHTNYGPQGYSPLPPERTIESPSQPAEMGDIPIEFNQCVFVRYFTMRWRMSIFPKVIRAGAGPHDLGSGDNMEDAFQELTIQPDVAGTTGSADGLEGPPGLTADDGGSEREIFVRNTPSNEKYDSWDVIADYIFQNSTAACALMHHRDLVGIRRAEGTEDIGALLGKHRPPIKVDASGVGRIVYEKTQQPEMPAQRTANLVELDAAHADDYLDSLEGSSKHKHPRDRPHNQPYETMLPDWFQRALGPGYLALVLTALRAREQLRERYRRSYALPELLESTSTKPLVEFYSVSTQRVSHYAEVSPYDRTRLDPGGRYLNASWVRELYGEKWWIVARMPSQDTVYTFLSVLLERISPPGLPPSRVRTVVQLTGDVGGGAHPYLPDAVGNSRVFNEFPGLGSPRRSFEVKLIAKNVVEEMHYTISTVAITGLARLARNVVQGPPVIFTHVSYTAWPDLGVPGPGYHKVLVNFAVQMDKINRIHASGGDPDPPIMVHSSSNSGCAGVFIALSSLWRSYPRLLPTPISTQPQPPLSPSPLGSLPSHVSEDLIAQEIDSCREQCPGLFPTDTQITFLYLTLGRTLCGETNLDHKLQELMELTYPPM